MFPSLSYAQNFVQALIAQTITGDTPVKGDTVDVSLAEGTVAAIINSSLASSGDTMTVTVQHSYTTTDGDFVAVTTDALVDPATGDADSFDQITASLHGGVQVLTLKKELLRRYVRMVFTGGGTLTGISIGAIFALPKKMV